MLQLRPEWQRGDGLEGAGLDATLREAQLERLQLGEGRRVLREYMDVALFVEAHRQVPQAMERAGVEERREHVRQHAEVDGERPQRAEPRPVEK